MKEVGLPLGILERMHLAIGEDIPSLKLSLLEGIASVEGGFHYWRYQYWRVSRFIGGTGFIVGRHRFIGGGYNISSLEFIALSAEGIASSAEGFSSLEGIALSAEGIASSAEGIASSAEGISSLEVLASSASSVIIGGCIAGHGGIGGSSRHWRHQQHNHTGRSAED